MSTDRTVRDMYVEGRRRWPHVEIEFEVFASHCLRAGDKSCAAKTLAYAADLYLACACAARHYQAMRFFEREMAGAARAAIARIDADPEFINETTQELWDRLLTGEVPKIADYSGRGPLQAWVRVTAMRLAIDRYREVRARRDRRIDLNETLIDPRHGPESELTRSRYFAAFQLAIEHAMSQLTARDRNLLRMHVHGGCSIDQIGRAYRVHRATAARWLDQARLRIFESVRTQFAREHPELCEAEFRSLARSLDSEIELTLPLAIVPNREDIQPTA